MSYQIFCVLLSVGYLQFVWCILLSCYVPLTAFIIMKLVQHRVRQRENGQQVDPNSFIGGLIQIPIPVPEILSTLTRTKFNGKM
jgi:hypothetical protein